MKIIKTICTGIAAVFSILPTFAQQTYEELEQLTVNEQVTTVITASEPTRLRRISYAVFCLKKKKKTIMMTISCTFI